MALAHGSTPLPKGAWSSTFGPDDGKTFSTSANQCAYAYRHPEGNLEIVECDIAGLPDEDGQFQPQAVIIRCPVCDDSLRVAMLDKPFEIGPRKMLRSPSGAPVAYRVLTVMARVQCGGQGVRPGDGAIVECPWDVLIFRGVAVDTPQAMGMMKAQMNHVNAGFKAASVKVEKMRKDGVDTATIQGWANALGQLRANAAPAFARALNGSYDPTGPGSVCGVWDVIDRCDKSVTDMMKRLQGV